MVEIEKKIWPEYFQAIVDGKKTYELRLDDFDCVEGDVLILKEWNPETEKYTGRVVKKKITRVDKINEFSKFWSDEKIEKFGLKIISFE